MASTRLVLAWALLCFAPWDRAEAAEAEAEDVHREGSSSGRAGVLDVAAEMPGLLRDEYVHVGYHFKLTRPEMRREGAGELWVSFESGMPRVRLRGMANSPRFGSGEITLVIDTSRQLMYATFNLENLHEGKCLIYPFPSPKESPRLMERLRWRKEQVVRWQGEGSKAMATGRSPKVRWTKSYDLDFLVNDHGKELRGVDLRDDARVSKTIRLSEPQEKGDKAPLGATDDGGLFSAPASCVPAAQVDDPMASVQLKPPYSKSSALNDLLLVLADYAKGGHWPRLFLVLSMIVVPGDVAVMIEDPPPPRLGDMSGVSFDYRAVVYKLGQSLAFDDPVKKIPKKDGHTSEGSIWLDLKGRSFRLSGEALGTKVGPLKMDLVARGPANRVYVNVNLTAQLEQQCVAYHYPAAPKGELKQLESGGSLSFLKVAEVDGEDCAVFAAPLAHARWIHIYVDLEKDRPEEILRSEVHKDGRMLRSINVLSWRRGEEDTEALGPKGVWGCEAQASNAAQLAHLGLRRAEHWSIELQDSLHAVQQLDPGFSVLEVLALAGDVAIMVREPEVPELWKLAEASFSYSLRGKDGQPVSGRFAANFAAGNIRMTVGSPAAGSDNISIALSEDALAVRVKAHAPASAPAAAPESASMQCLTLPLEDASACSASSVDLPCGRGEEGRCSAVGHDIFVCKQEHCHSGCTLLFGHGRATGCLDPNQKTPRGDPCSVECGQCLFACTASCQNVPPVDVPCVATLYEGPDFGGWSATFLEGSFDTAAMRKHGALTRGASGVTVTGDGCVATLFKEPGLQGKSASFAEGSYQADALHARGLLHAVNGVLIQRQALTLQGSDGRTGFAQRTVFYGVRAWLDRPYVYAEVPEELIGAVLFAGPFSDLLAGNMTLTSPRPGSVYVWGDEGSPQEALLKRMSDSPGLAGWGDGQWRSAGVLLYTDHHDLRRTARVYKRDVEAAVPVKLPVAQAFVGGVAFHDSPRQLGHQGPRHTAGGAASGAMGIFDGVEMVDGRECNRFSYRSTPPVELWYSVMDESVRRLLVLPRLGEAGPGVTLELGAWSPSYALEAGSAEDNDGSGPPASWHCAAAAQAEKPWVYLGAAQYVQQADVLPASTALGELVEAAGAIGLLPPQSLRTLSRLAVVAPGSSIPVQPSTPSAPAPPPPTVDIFGPELQSFSFSFHSATSPPRRDRGPHLDRWARGEVGVDLKRRLLYLQSEGVNVSVGIPSVRTRVVYRGDKGRLHSQMEVGTFQQCWSINAKEDSTGRDGSSVHHNPFMQASRTSVKHARELLLGARRSVGLIVSDDNKVLKRLELRDLRKGWIVEVTVKEWSTSPIPLASFDPGDSADGCADLNFLEQSDNSLSMDLLRAFFPVGGGR